MKTIRKGLGLGKGKGYYNLVQRDPYIHALSAKGVKSQQVNKAFDIINKMSPEERSKFIAKGIATQINYVYQPDEVSLQKLLKPDSITPTDEEDLEAKGKKFRDMTDDEFFSLDSNKMNVFELYESIRETARRHKENINRFRREGDEKGLNEYLKEYNLHKDWTMKGIKTYAKGKKSKKSNLIKIEIYNKDTGEVVKTLELTRNGFGSFLTYFSIQADKDYKFRVV